MSDELLARDPVFGEVARALCPIASSQPTLSMRGPYPVPANLLREVGWSQVRFRTAALELEDRRQLESMRALTALEGGWSQLSMPRFALAEFEQSASAVRALLAAHDNVIAPPREPQLMGVVNVTPDSFSDGGEFLDPEAAIAHGLSLVEAGAEILDVGGESTRPGSSPVDEQEESQRVVPVIRGLSRRTRVAISVDTTKSAVAAVALDVGATIVNDVSAGRFDPRMLPLVAARGATIVLMHMQGVPRDMQQHPTYSDVVSEVLEFLRERAAECLAAGIERNRIWIDPGIGFGKQVEHNLALLRGLSELRSLGLPLVLGPSRKSFIAAIHPPAKSDTRRLGGTAAAVAFGVVGGVDILRVHDVAVMKEAVAVARAIARDSAGS
ncbi:MAG: dihydropteroate synthase [Planctomycetota bacterium]|nr:dihydropteroate synthase [Planctomycetota bacterium]